MIINRKDVSRMPLIIHFSSILCLQTKLIRKEMNSFNRLNSLISPYVISLFINRNLIAYISYLSAVSRKDLAISAYHNIDNLSNKLWMFKFLKSMVEMIGRFLYVFSFLYHQSGIGWLCYLADSNYIMAVLLASTLINKYTFELNFQKISINNGFWLTIL